MKLTILLFFLFLLSLALLLNFQNVSAENLSGQVMGQIQAGANKAELGTPYKPQEVVALVIQLVLGLVGMIFIALMVMGGYYLLASHGEEEREKKGRSLIQGAIIGLVIILLSYAITIFVSSRVQQAAVETQVTQ